MKEFAAAYMLLPIVYFMYRAGELAREKGYNPLKWKFLTYLITGSAGSILGGVVYFTSNNRPPPFHRIYSSTLTAGFFLISRLKRRRTLPHPQKYRVYSQVTVRNSRSRNLPFRFYGSRHRLRRTFV